MSTRSIVANPDFEKKIAKKHRWHDFYVFWIFRELSRQNDVANSHAAQNRRNFTRFHVFSILAIFLVKSQRISGMKCKTVFLRIFMSYEICLPGIGLDWWPLLWPWLLSSHYRFHGACEFLASMSSLELQITTTFIKIGGLVFCQAWWSRWSGFNVSQAKTKFFWLDIFDKLYKGWRHKKAMIG